MIKVTSKIVRNIEDLSIKDPQFEEILTKFNDKWYLEVQVEDTGIGIKNEDKSKLFKLFGFLESSQEINSKGIGLGLYISK